MYIHTGNKVDFPHNCISEIKTAKIHSLRQVKGLDS